MKKMLSIVCLIGTLLLNSCRRDDLYYATNDRATVRIEADWEPARLTPNGVSAYVFDRDGNAFGPVVQSSNPGKVDLSLPEGSYQVILLNNTFAEYRNVECAGADKLSTFALMASVVSPNFTLKSDTRTDIFVGVPDTVAGSVVRNIEIDHKMIEYFRQKPQGQQTTPAVVLPTTPERMISVADIKVHVKGLKYAAGAPRTHLKNLSTGYYPDSGKAHPGCICHEFVLNDRRFDPGSTRDGTIGKELATFGLHESDDIQYLLNMEFVLINGEKYPITLDVTDGLRVTQDVHEIIHIEAEIELPEVIGNGDGAFDPNLEEWDDIEIDIPM